MESNAEVQQPLITWQVAARAWPRSTVCGDLHLVKRMDRGVLLAVIDGLGHGPEAFAAAQVARALLEEYSEEPLGALVNRCHAGLRKTRWVVMTVATIGAVERDVTWLGV